MSGRELQIVSTPPVEDSNHYMGLFYGSLAPYGVRVRRDIVNSSLKNLWKNRRSFGVFHVHWAEAPAGVAGLVDVFKFTLKLLLCKLCGIRVLWTAHNLMPHDAKNTAVQLVKRIILVHMSDMILVHFEGAKRQIARKFFVSEKKMVRMSIGTYEDSFPNVIGRAEARKKLSLDEKSCVFLYLGAVRRYKNVETLIRAFKGLDAPDAVLVIAGKPLEESYANELRALIGDDKRIRCHFIFVPDGEVQTYFNACDVAVFPYREFFTSGAAMLALTFGRPVIMKKCAFTEEYLTPRDSILVDGCTEPNLREALGRFYRERGLSVDAARLAPYRWAEIGKNVFEQARRRGFFS